jgi:hypothetical protein
VTFTISVANEVEIPNVSAMLFVLTYTLEGFEPGSSFYRQVFLEDWLIFRHALPPTVYKWPFRTEDSRQVVPSRLQQVCSLFIFNSAGQFFP